MGLVFAVERPDVDDVRALVETHVGFAHEGTPEGSVHALAVEALGGPDITLWTARRAGELLGIGALRHLDDEHAEVKSMHTAAASRGQGIGRAMIEHLVRTAAAEGYRRVSLETGTSDVFAAARTLYSSVGFEPCEPFGEYFPDPFSICMTRTVAG